MKREELLKSKEYWITQFQINLFETVDEYLHENNISRSDFADKMGVSKSYITQVLNGDFDHKISKFVELLLACNKVPIINTIELDQYIYDDLCQLKHVLYTDIGKQIKVQNEKSKKIKKIEPTYEISYFNKIAYSGEAQTAYY